jgi:hypothetical protein
MPADTVKATALFLRQSPTAGALINQIWIIWQTFVTNVAPVTRPVNMPRPMNSASMYQKH